MVYKPILVVDENDKPIGEAQMEEVHENGLYHRIVRVLLEDDQGRILLQKRSSKLLLAPGLWDLSASGHVDGGETYEQAAHREAEEEIDVHDLELTEIAYWKSNKTHEDGWILNRFNKTYKAKIGDQIAKPNPEEVAELRWFTVEDAKKILAEHPNDLTNGLQKMLKELS